MRTARICFLMILLCGAAIDSKAQDKPELTLETDVVSQYVWRGLELGSCSLQPTVGISWKGFSLSAWGSVGLTDRDDCTEIDVTAQYSTGNLSLGIVDYWNDEDDNRYFHYNSHSTYHAFEGFIAYDFGILNASWQTMFAGNDGVNNSGKRAYSSYFEVNVPFNLSGFNCDLSVGAVPYATTYYETDKFNVTRASLRVTKEIKLNDHFTVPVFGEIATNPHSQKAWFVFGFTIQ